MSAEIVRVAHENMSEYNRIMKLAEWNDWYAVATERLQSFNAWWLDRPRTDARAQRPEAA